MIDCYRKKVLIEEYESSSINARGECNRERFLLSSHALYGRYDRSVQAIMALDCWLGRSPLPSDLQNYIYYEIEQFHGSIVLRSRYIILLTSLIIFQSWSSRNFFVRPLTVPLGPQLSTSSLVLIPKTEDSSDKKKPFSN